MSEFVVPDTFYEINIEGWDRPVLVNAKYDRVDHFPDIGGWILKVYDDEEGLMSMHVDQATAMRVAEYACLPIVIRPTMFESEYAGHCKAEIRMMEEEFDGTEDTGTWGATEPE